MSFSYHIVIPARFDSQRLPGKPLLDIAGKPLIQRVYECAQQSDADSITIATDNQEIFDRVEAFRGVVYMTRKDHLSGTDRVAEATQLLGLAEDALVLNLQGDEPLISPVLINQVAQALVNAPDVMISSACCPIESLAEYQDPNVVKVVRNQRRLAAYFSRAPIPWIRDEGSSDRSGMRWSDAYRHLGIYAYRVGYLTRFCELPPAPTELTEKLEQLRALWYGDAIMVCDAKEIPGPGVDTAQDLRRVVEYFESLPAQIDKND